MREVIIYTAASIDGNIAGPGGNIDWLHDPEFNSPGEDNGYTDFYAVIETTLMGNNTFEMIRGFDVPFPYPDKRNYVFKYFNNSGKLRNPGFYRFAGIYQEFSQT